MDVREAALRSLVFCFAVVLLYRGNFCEQFALLIVLR